MKRFILAFIAAYVFIFAWGWLLNGVFLKDVYAETPNLWRSQSEMMSLFHWIITGQALLVFAFVAICERLRWRRGDFGNSAWCSAGNRSDRHASSHLCGPAISREVDHLRQYKRPLRNDNRRRDRWGDLQTRIWANSLATELRSTYTDLELDVGR